MELCYQFGEGIIWFFCGIQLIILLVLVECGLDIFVWIDMQCLCDKLLVFVDLFIELVESCCECFGLILVILCEYVWCGSYVSFEYVQGYVIVQVLIDWGVIGDYCELGILCFGFILFYICFVEVWDVVQVLLEIFQSEVWKELCYQVWYKVI